MVGDAGRRAPRLQPLGRRNQTPVEPSVTASLLSPPAGNIFVRASNIFVSRTHCGIARFAPHSSIEDPTAPADKLAREPIEIRMLVFDAG